jgi:hypothetical protein
MPKFFSNIWNDPVWSKVIASAIVAIGGITYFDGWSWIASFLERGARVVADSSTLPNWVIGLMFVGCSIAVVAVLLWLRSKGVPTATWQSYTEDEVLGLRWRWKWNHGQIASLYAFCPRCDFQMFPENTSAWDALDKYSYHCAGCSSDIKTLDENPERFESTVKRFIQQKVRNGQWESRS